MKSTLCMFLVLYRAFLFFSLHACMHQGTYVERVTGAQYEGEFAGGFFHGLGKLSLPCRSSSSSTKQEGKSPGKTSGGDRKKSARPFASPRVSLSSRCSRIGVKTPYSLTSTSLSGGQEEDEEDTEEEEEDQEREDGRGEEKKKKKKDESLKGVTICGEWERGKVRGVATCAYEDGCLYTGTLQVRKKLSFVLI